VGSHDPEQHPRCSPGRSSRMSHGMAATHECRGREPAEALPSRDAARALPHLNFHTPGLRPDRKGRSAPLRDEKAYHVLHRRIPGEDSDPTVQITALSHTQQPHPAATPSSYVPTDASCCSTRGGSIAVMMRGLGKRHPAHSCCGPGRRGSGATLEGFEEVSRRQYADLIDAPQGEQVLVAGDDDVGVCRQSGFDEAVIVGISGDRDRLCWGW
jgi:hypothetical protein